MSSSPKLSVTSISDIARIAGVSASTVSRALAGSKMISLDTRTRINDLAREHGFQLNQMARNLRLKRTQAIGIVFPHVHENGQHVSDPFFVTMLGHVADNVTRRGYDLVLSRVVPTDTVWLDVLVSSGRVDGVIVVGQSDQDDVLTRAAAGYDRMVVWGERGEGRAYCTAGTDNVAGAEIATRHLLDGGRRRIVFAGHADDPEISARYQGFCRAHRRAGIEPAGVIPAPSAPDGGYALIADYLDGHDAPDGIVAVSDLIAISAIRALAARGLKVPGDVWVTGYDDAPVAAQVTPPLTTVRQDLGRGAAHMVDLLFRRLGGEATESIVMAPELVVRDSAP